MFSVMLFVFASVLLGSMVFYRLWEIRVGRFNRREVAGRELVFSGAHIETINNQFLNFVREAAHIALIIIVRLTIGILFVIRREARRIAAKLDHFFLQNGSLGKNERVSFFLKDISEYKNHIQKIVSKVEGKRSRGKHAAGNHPASAQENVSQENTGSV